MKMIIGRPQGFWGNNGENYPFFAGNVTEENGWYVFENFFEFRKSDVTDRVVLPEDFDLSTLAPNVLMFGR